MPRCSRMRKRRDGSSESSGQNKKTSTHLSAHTPALSFSYRDTLREGANLSRLARPPARLSWAYRRTRLEVIVLLSHSSATGLYAYDLQSLNCQDSVRRPKMEISECEWADQCRCAPYHWFHSTGISQLEPQIYIYFAIQIVFVNNKFHKYLKYLLCV